MRRSGVCACIAISCVALLIYLTVGARNWERGRTTSENTARASVNSSMNRPVSVTAAQPPTRNRAAMRQNYDRLPLAFEPNVGQTDPRARFLARGNGYITFLTPQKAVLELRANSQRKKGNGREPLLPGPMEAAALSMTLEGANPQAQLVAMDKLPGISNYLIGRNSADWHTNIPNYRKVGERGVYPGIDLVYYGTQRQLEYDFVVAPGAQPSEIRLKIDGARKLRVDGRGALEASIAGGTVELQKPAAYQETAGTRQPVAAEYVAEKGNRVALRVGNYDRGRALVIDPVLAYSTYLGGSGVDVANGIAVAPDDTAFVAGGTLSTNYPVVNFFQGVSAGGEDAFVTKISADGSALVYSTYLGGGAQDIANGIAVDDIGEAYVTGSTDSAGFPVTALSAFPACGGDGKCGASWNTQGDVVSNGFVTKLNVTGTGLVYSTFIGIYEHTSSHAISVDANGIAYITGEVEGAFPVTIIPPPVGCPGLFPTNGFEPNYPGGVPGTSDGCPYIVGGAATSGFVMALSANGEKVLYSTYLGGTVQDVGFGIAADNHGNVNVTGLTYSGNFPLKNAVDPAYGGLGDAFFTKLNTAASGAASLLYSTYLGGSALDQGNAVAIDSSGNAYVAGITASGSLPFGTLNGYSGDSDAFIAELNPSSSGAASLVFFRYLGGTLADGANGIAVDSSNNIYVTGSTSSPDFPIVGEAFQTAYGGGNADAFVTKIAPGGVNLVYSSYLGGTNTDVGNGIAVDAAGAAFVAGETCSLDFPLAHPIQANSGGNCDAFAAKVEILSGILLNPSGLVFSAQSLGTTSAVEAVTITNGDNPVTINGITIVGASAGEFAETNTCPGSLSPGGMCSISVTFTPTTTGLAKAAIAISDSAPGSPQVVSLSGSTSTLTLSAATINFGNQQTGQASQPQTITATNQGNSAITFTTLTTSGAFSESDDCTKAPLQATTNCTISVTFTPTVAGQAIGALEISDNAPGSPQEVLLYGTGTGLQTDFSFGIQPPSAAISAGDSAQFTLSMAPIGNLTTPVSISCSGLPAQSACAAAGNPVTLGGATNVPLAINTTARTMAPPAGPGTWTAPPSRLWLLAGLWLAVLLLGLLLSAVAPGLRIRRKATVLALAVAIALLSAACNGGTQQNATVGTPAGTYAVTVTGTAGSITHSATVSLQVK